MNLSGRKTSAAVIGLMLTLTLSACGSSNSSVQEQSGSSDPAVSAANGTSASNANTDTSQAAASSNQANAPFLSFKDTEGREVTLSSQPQRIVVLSPEILNMIYAIGGEVLGRADAADIELPSGAEKAESVGQVSEVSSEKILALQPDLVIGQPRFHKDLAQTFESSSIPFALMQVSSYDQIADTVELLGKITGKEAEAKEQLDQLQQRVDAIKAKLPDKQLTFANMNVTPASVSIQRSGTIGLDIAKTMNMTNVAEQLEPDKKSPTTVPYSLEKLVEQDPDYLFLIIHGSRATGEKKIKTDMESNPAWSSLKAVKEKHVVIVPSSLFLTNPGLKYDESMTYLAQYVYPDIFGAPAKEEASGAPQQGHGK
ncbi:hypothetical protein AWM70_07390 [Paenibacillus yonginensis]|uniref:Fe/B12 periplasmic-binding domain-containing protein n=1 Tax=Paenibacillus yonginensis TaxID=1462996 RepID=A0A1B1MZ23_9BACL|nr:ABC transporter substrate-binding protein [Paenibacillus yonginensis]ANS74424.1 hypothetical protein AWM70_07390 [Paenibacillus yonginensis]